MLNKFNILLINLVFTTIFLLVSLSAIIPLFKSIDEVLLIISLIIVLVYGGVALMFGKIYTWFIFLLLYFIIQLINYFSSPFDLNIIYVLLQSIINVKLFLGILLVYILSKEEVIKKRYVDFVWVSMILIFILGIILNWIVGESWNIYFTDRVRYRYGILRSVGSFADVGVNGYFFSLFFTTFYFVVRDKYANLLSSKRIVLFSLINLIASLILTVRKNLVSIIVVFFSFIREVKTFQRLFASFLLLISFFLLIFLAYIYGIFDDLIGGFLDDDTSYIRILMFTNGFRLMVDFFPFGVGSGTFGTLMSNFNTLEVYEYVGINLRHYTNIDGSLRGVYDCGFSSFIAENGFIGFLIIVGLITGINTSFKALFTVTNYKIYYILILFTLLLTFSEPIAQSGFYTVFFMVNLLKINFNKNLAK